MIPLTIAITKKAALKLLLNGEGADLNFRLSRYEFNLFSFKTIDSIVFNF